ncbi:IDEAL domain-containing protein [Priestia megaterium]|uniref:IDEAL domain-containing protein n=1 Tax=Priestia megaterium TaxID=1404 RepID=UPI0033976D61
MKGLTFYGKNTLNGMDRVDPNLRDEMLAELFLDQMMNNFKKSKILEEIDQSLKNKDKEAFFRLTEKLKSVS